MSDSPPMKQQSSPSSSSSSTRTTKDGLVNYGTINRYLGYWFVSDLIELCSKATRTLTTEETFHPKDAARAIGETGGGEEDIADVAVTYGDMWRLLPEDQIDPMVAEYEKLRGESGEENSNNNSKKSSYLGAVLSTSKAPLIIAGLFQLLRTVSEAAIPIFLREIIQSIADNNFIGLYWGLGMVGLAFSVMLSNHVHLRLMDTAMIRARALSIFMIYKKASKMKLHQSEGLQGQVATLISADSQRFIDGAPVFQMSWASPVQIVISTYVIYRFISLPALVSVGILLSVFPIATVFSGSLGAVRRKLAAQTELRVNSISEFLQGVKVVKTSGWEKHIRKMIVTAREKELHYFFYELIVWVAQGVFMILLGHIAAFGGFAVFVETEGSLKTADAFATLSAVSIMKFPIMMFGISLQYIVQLKIGAERIQKFLDQEDVITSHREKKTEESSSGSSKNEPIDSSDAKSSEMREEVTTIGRRIVSSISSAENEDEAIVALYDSGAKEAEPTTESSATNADEVTASSPPPNTDIVWSLTSASAAERQFHLKNIAFSLKRGESLAIMGAVGTGKSLLCTAMLGEAVILGNTTLKSPLKIGYSSQDSFLISGTVRENITFQQEFDEDKYFDVLDACQLWPDLEAYPDGDQTLVGERGVTLSGGQKARIALARVAYAQAEFNVLDDPFSALDAKTGAKVADSLLGPEGLLAQSAVIFVTHSVHNLKHATYVMSLDNPHAKELLKENQEKRSSSSGTPGDAHEEQEGESKPSVVATAAASWYPRPVLLSQFDATALGSVTPLESTRAAGATGKIGTGKNTGRVASAANKTGDAGAGQADDDEQGEREKADRRRALLAGAGKKSELSSEDSKGGTVRLGTFADFGSAAGGCLWVAPTIFCFILERCTFVSMDIWLSVWTSAENGEPDHWIGRAFDTPAGDNKDGSKFYMRVFAVILCCSFVMATVRLSIFGNGSSRATRTLFMNALDKVLACPMVFFDTTPAGRIVNRFSHDVDRTMFTLTAQLNSFFSTMGWFSTGMIVVGISAPIALSFLIPTAIVVFYYLWRFRSANVHFQRLDATSRSSLQSHIYEGVQGTATIRAFGVKDEYIEVGKAALARNSECINAFSCGQRWISVRVEGLGALILGGVPLLCWALRGSISPQVAGLAIVWGMIIPKSMMFAMTDGIQGEAKLVSVERLTDYARSLPEEPPRTIAEKQPPSSWPEKGRVELADARMKYRPELPLVLDGASVVIEPKNRVGIVGRTGAGKSSITVALFRLRELFSGSIIIDGVDISEIGLDALRGGKISMVPQDPILFSGSIRSNVDPFGECSDEQVKSALERVQLWEPVCEKGTGLDTNVGEQGKDLSVGQRQLVCIARALLRDPSVLILDEATANVDHETDELIQEMVRDLFKDTTVIEIAHRLHTVMDADKIIVMNRGQVAEYDSPAALLRQEESIFSSLVDSTGAETSLELREIAIKTEISKMKEEKEE